MKTREKENSQIPSLLGQWAEQTKVENQPVLPQAQYLWWKARLRRREKAQRRAERTLLVLESVIILAAVGLVVGSAFWIWPLLPELPELPETGALLPANPPQLLLMFILSLVTILVLHDLIARER